MRRTEPPETYVPSRMRTAQVQSLAITHTHTLAVAGLPDHHRDPFDRLLIAQSRTESLPLATVDPLIRLYDLELITPTP
jgi:PIN domain nuclease of toxin-antitoxin system